MGMTFFLFFCAAALIYVSCEYFVNAVEWVGHQFGISKTATGTVLAAFGTALPESVVTFVAVVFGQDAAQKEIGIGAAIGGPLVLATIAYAVIGWIFFNSKMATSAQFISQPVAKDLLRDQKWFMAIFVVKVALGLIAFAYKPWLGILFLVAYAAYVRHELSRQADVGQTHELEPLKIRPKLANPPRMWAVLQIIFALIAIYIGSQVFVHQLESIGPWLGLSPQMVALLLAPVATELPEILNAVIWVRQGKQDLAFANISGAMMIQATIPSALGIFFTPWMLQPPLVWAAVMTMVSILGIYFLLNRGTLGAKQLRLFLVPYGVFAVGLIWFA